jgi:hypothetical protein
MSFQERPLTLVSLGDLTDNFRGFRRAGDMFWLHNQQ